MKILCRTALLTTLAALALTGCDSDDQKAPGSDDKKPQQPAAATIGAAGSGCELPVSFGIAEGWKPKQVTVEANDPLAALAKKGPFTMACEIDAKPAGKLGFLRVWTGGRAGLKDGLTAFIGDRAQQPAFTEVRIGGKPGLAVDYQQKSQLDDGLEKEAAFVVDSGKGLVLVSLDSFDNDEHAAMRPAYQLARDSLTVN
ncbi:lipoprotein [Actinoplanes oblitus]|uniref:Lipoprotein n=1 Tax=Actinoplanes oblitus TaxID=3040509 RepID=A0ABY8WAQ5_9ACTN|nr:lipoprotein [Actinoplanes oblitus]WIM94216.1 lipoprotein [Actinoplanes oblitus]